MMQVKMPVSERIRRMRAKDERHAWLWGVMAQDLPDLQIAELNDWQFVNLLRNWVFRNVRREARIAGEPIAGYLDNDPDFGFYSKDAPDIFRAFRENRGGVIGGGCCWSMQTTYEAFDYPAAIIDTGEQGGEYTRIGVVVEIYHDGDFIWTVQDPNYDFVLADHNGEPISYFRALTYLARREPERLSCFAGPADAYRLMIVFPHQEAHLASDWIILPGEKPVERLADGRALYRAHMTWARFQEHAGEMPYNVLKRAGVPANLLYYFALPFGIYPPHSPYRQLLWDRITYALGDIGPLPA